MGTVGETAAMDPGAIRRSDGSAEPRRETAPPSGPAGPAVRSGLATRPPGQPSGWLEVACAAGLAGLVAVLAGGELSPPSLWLDDAWQALVVRADSLEEALRTTVSYPGYVLLLIGVLWTVGFSELTAQLPAFVIGCAVPAAFVLVMTRRGLSTPAALLGGAVLATSPILVTFTTRVKHYTLDALLAVLLLGLAWWVADDPGDSRRWTVLVLGTACATFASAGVAPLATAGLLAAAVAALLARRGTATAMVSITAYLVAALVWWQVVIEPRTTGALQTFWSDHFLRWEDGAASLAGQIVTALAELAGSLSGAPPQLVALAAVAGTAVAVFRRLELAVLVAAPIFGALLAAALELAPVGTGRTDSYLLPALALAVAFGAEEVVRARERGDRWAHMIGPWGPIGAVLVITAGLAVAVDGQDTSYPDQDLQPLVAVVEDEAADGDPIRVHPLSQWAYALYTRYPVELVPEEEQPTGFRPVFADERVDVFEPQRAHPERYAQLVEEWVEQAPRFWLLASHLGDDLIHLRTLIERQGWEVTWRESREDALLELWEPR
jgi:hypothetical protein